MSALRTAALLLIVTGLGSPASSADDSSRIRPLSYYLPVHDARVTVTKASRFSARYRKIQSLSDMLDGVLPGEIAIPDPLPLLGA